MTMTNPDKPITKQDLNNYHNAILPYLGGMPDVLANKFSKGDLYDTSEKMIGKWIDGRPLYQRVIELTSMSAYASSNKYIIPSSVTGFTIDIVPVSFEFTNDYSQSYASAGICSIRSTDSAFIIEGVSLAYPNIGYYITVKYTKNSDNPNSFNVSSETDYSTDEHIVGTWIDGSYLYQKTINLTLPSVFIDTKIGEVPLNTDICFIVNCFGVRNNGQKWVIPNYYTSDDIADVYIANNDISARAKGLFVSMPIYLTIQYTKTS